MKSGSSEHLKDLSGAVKYVAIQGQIARFSGPLPLPGIFPLDHIHLKQIWVMIKKWSGYDVCLSLQNGCRCREVHHQKSEVTWLQDWALAGPFLQIVLETSPRKWGLRMKLSGREGLSRMPKTVFSPQPAACGIVPFLNSHKYWNWFLKKKTAPLCTKTSAIKEVGFFFSHFLGYR